MSKKAAGRKRTPAKRRKGLKKVVVIGVILSLVCAGMAVALLRPTRPEPKLSAAASVVAPIQSQGNFSPTSPAKEYIYAGGRLVATEEPTPTPTPPPPPPCTPPTTLIISEFRLRGASGANDEFVEFYNNSDSAITVCTADQSAGWTLAARKADGTSASPVFTIPYGTVIPARGHYLAVNNGTNGYSLSNYPAGNGTTATGDITYTTDIEDDSGIALFVTSNTANFTTANRLDAAGFSSPSGTIPDLYREGSGLAPIGSSNGEYTFVRKMTSASGGLPQDTGVNASDFFFLSTDGGIYNGVRAPLGAPGPENLSSPVQRNTSIGVTLLDPTVSSSSSPNRVRDFTPDQANNSTFGTMSIRRHVTNNTGANVTRLRFRVTDITTFPAPSGVADLRPRTSGAIQVTVQGVVRTVQGTTVEQPPSQPNGGGYNTTMSVGTVTLAQPLAPGASVDVQFLLGIQQTGSFRFFINVEVLP